MSEPAGFFQWICENRLAGHAKALIKALEENPEYIMVVALECEKQKIELLHEKLKGRVFTLKDFKKQSPVKAPCLIDLHVHLKVLQESTETIQRLCEENTSLKQHVKDLKSLLPDREGAEEPHDG